MIDGRTPTPVDMSGPMSILEGLPRDTTGPAGFLVRPADTPDHHQRYRALRRVVFVDAQGVFEHSDIDETDLDDRTVVLVAVTGDGDVVGGVRLAPVGEKDIGWWTGSRLVVAPDHRGSTIASALIRAAVAHAEGRGVLRFDACVNATHRGLFTRLGWTSHGDTTIGDVPHVHMRRPMDRIARTAHDTKSFLADVLAPLRTQAGGLGPAGFVGDDGVPVPGGDTIAACDAILPSMVDRDPWWAGWCSVLVNLNDLAAMAATPIGLLDAVGARTTSQLTRVVRGLAAAAAAWDVPVLGGHTQVGVPASLSVTALGSASRPVPAGGGRVGDALRLTVDVTGGWRPGYTGAQWDSTSRRGAEDLRAMNGMVRRSSPHAAKDVSMAGIVGTTGMLAEASGTGVVVDVAAVPRPAGADMASWLTCFPGYGMLTADAPDAAAPTVPVGVVTAPVGRLTTHRGVRLRWPDGVETDAVGSSVTGLGAT
ncbi:MAG: GNAT family N-acetyltransferase [Gordonia paraffinivorans]